MRAAAADMETSTSTSTSGSRRSASAIVEPGSKKPRYAAPPAPLDDTRPLRPAQNPRDPRIGGGGGGSYNNSSSSNNNSNSGGGGGGISSLVQQNHLQELVAQYNTALSELTFNSKPIITNLTIIAGENLHAAKAIAATICANILEVPSEQKLPSLYLLDSIVKNIGRDYIKHFAARLPEVFCKAYRLVDPSIHPSMRHLFGTWKGVFSPASLQMIEKELGFQSVVNGSSGSTPSRPDSQSQRPSHSIHVNPKYLEARQHLQQPNKGREVSNVEPGAISNSGDDAERTHRTAIDRSTVRRPDVLSSRPTMQRNQKQADRDVRGPGFSDIAQQSDVTLGHVRSKFRGQDGFGGTYYSAGVGSSEEQYDKRNSFNANKDFRSSGSARSDGQLLPVHTNNSDRSVTALSKSWKNSEEEEYLWDDVNSRGADYRGTNSIVKGDWNTEDGSKFPTLQRGKWTQLGGDLSEYHSHKLESLSRFANAAGQDGRISPYKDHEERLLHTKRDADLRIDREMPPEGRHFPGSRSSSQWVPHEKTLAELGFDQRISRFSSPSDERAATLSGGLSTSITSSVPIGGSVSYIGQSSLGSSTHILSRSGETYGQQRQRYWPPSSPSIQSPSSSASFVRQNSPSPGEPDNFQSRSFPQMGQKPVQHQEEFDRRAQPPIAIDTSRILAQNAAQHSQSRPNLQATLPQAPQQMQNRSSISSELYPQSRPHLKTLDQSQTSFSHHQTQTVFVPSIPLPLSVGSGAQQPGEVSVKGDSNNPATVSSGKMSATNLLAGLIKSGFRPNNTINDLASSNVQPPLPSGPPPTHVLTSVTATSSSLWSPAPVDSSTAPQSQLSNTVLPPLPPGPPPQSSFVCPTAQISENAGSFSSLLSSLVAKGLISSPATDSSIANSAKPNKPSNQSGGFANNDPNVTSSAMPVAVVQPSSAKEPSASDSPAPKNAPLPRSAKAEVENLIGFEFRPEILRTYHPQVVCSLFDDQSQQCRTCGVRFRFEEQLSVHSAWHASRQAERGSSGAVSRKWFGDKNSWIRGSVAVQTDHVELTAFDAVGPEQACEAMVPADENQFICALCGEPFEDIYSDESGEWMYKDAVYFDAETAQGGCGSMDENKEQIPIVHARCRFSSSHDGMEVD